MLRSGPKQWRLDGESYGITSLTLMMYGACMWNVMLFLVFFILFIKHAPSPGSDTTYYNVTSY